MGSVKSGRSNKTLPSSFNRSLIETAPAPKDKMYPIEIKDIKQVPKEKIISAKIGADSDSYLMYAIKSKRADILKFLLREVPELDILRRNSLNMSALHLAIRSNSL